MLAAAVPSGFAGRVADFGAGAGAAGLAVASRCPQASSRAGRECAGHARLRRTNHRASGQSRISRAASRCIAADVALAGKARAAGGLADGSFDFAIMNPPFNAGHDRATPDALKRDAHVMPDGMFERWIRSAAAIVQPARRSCRSSRGRNRSSRSWQRSPAASARSRSCRSIRGRTRPRSASSCARVRASRAGLSLMPPLSLHEAAGNRFSTARRRHQQRPGVAFRRLTPTSRRHAPLRKPGEILHPRAASRSHPP